MFRETLEAALVVGIVLSYLVRSGRSSYKRVVFLGLAAGVVASVLGALSFELLAGDFGGRSEEIFEGITMLAGAVLLTTLILWMMGKQGMSTELERKVAEELSKARRTGLFFLVFFSVLREGIESVIFLKAASFASAENNLLGAGLGLISAVLFGLLLFKGILHINLKSFFTVTNILLILFAAGLTAGGVHELQEAGVLPVLVEHVWDINPAAGGDSYPLLHENGFLGSIAKGLFGYNGNPSLLEVFVYIGYLAVIVALWLKAMGRRRTSPRQYS